MTIPKKIISLLLSVIMIMSVFTTVPFTASAVEKNIFETGATSGNTGDCTWTLNGKELTISGNGKMGAYTYFEPAPWGVEIESVIITDGVTNVGSYAFYGCENLTTVILPDSIKSIDEYAFNYCIGLTNLEVPDSVTNIGNDAFYNCSGLTDLSIGNSVETIGDCAFENCEFSSINLPESLTNLGRFAFRACSLENIDIPASVTNIGKNPFASCSYLQSLTVDPGNTVYDSRNDCNAIIETATNTLISGTKNTIIPNTVSELAEHSFYGCYGLTDVSIPDSVTVIGDWAFYSCNSLTSISIPASVNSIGLGIVSDCASSNFERIVVSSDNPVYDSRDNCNAIIETSTNTLIAGCGKTVIPNTVSHIAPYAFEGCLSLESITIPDSVTSIGEYSFFFCYWLKEITIPDTVTNIDEDAFGLCPHLTIYGTEGSEAERYANDNGIQFVQGAPITGITVSGSITSYVDDADVTIKLTGADNNFTAETNGKADYSIEAVPAGEYTLTVSKANHVTREYNVTVTDADLTQDVKVCPKGDVNGDGETDIMDCSLAQRYIRELTDLDPYQIACGDVSGTGDGELDIQDVSRILRHIRELAMLY